MQINYEVIVDQLKTELDTDCAISNRYGIVQASNIETFAKDKIIPQKILELINNRKEIAEELSMSDINSFALEAQEYNYLFTFSEELILISKVDLGVNLAKFMPSIRIFTQKLSKSSKDLEIKEFSKFEFNKEIENIEENLSQSKSNKEKFSIVKDLIKFIAK